MASSQPFRLIKRPVETSSSLASIKKKPRLKTSGDYNLRELTGSESCQTNDEVHQSIELCPVMKALIDTKVFQRLRHIRQLGTSEYLYNCATGNRFQHSLGVAHLAEMMCKNIKKEQPNLGATDKDVFCVKLAGLLHDVGHGPYSHLYECFRENMLPNYLDNHPELKAAYDDCKDLKIEGRWSHEDSSMLMIDTVLAELGLEIDLRNMDHPLKQIGDGVDAATMRVFKPPNQNNSVLTSRDWVFIKECILGKPLPLPGFDNKDFIGRTEATKEWLYDIVSNRHSGLDVDKVDYFARDSRSAFGPEPIEYKLIEDARVAKGQCDKEDCPTCQRGPGFHYMICYPEKRVPAAMKFFRKRLDLHDAVYQNKKTVAAECLLYDILCSADPFIRLKSDDGVSFPPSRAVLKSEFLMKLDDSIIPLIGHSTDQNLEEARALFERLRRHDMYKCAVDERLVTDSDRYYEDDNEELEEKCKRDKLLLEMSDLETYVHNGMLLEKQHCESPFPLDANDFIVRKYDMHYGRKHRNPVSFMRFYEKDNEKLVGPLETLPRARKYDVSKWLGITPISFRRVGIRVFCRDPSKRDLVNQVFHQWFERMLRGEVGEAEFTPGSPFGLELRGDSDCEEEDNDDNDGFQQDTVPLTQESVGEGDSENHIDGPSPIPVRHRSRRP
ncbi:Deoxynucleoside triphosphate triphosphohydrolase SAMHD1 [Seminavis robusta]|uniref:Deoxynucleoside triphosphate triphosphohydrolase SAMHD1 n=1 Tax=Seminavis robusta TaxID=568900 RepID=A0A9N8HH55_9STRA|nr:Deoxynucleoside triphosphate triphosphohydrolase SAMHD1 [Seminavis robusta]|eukprot:Sro684_g186750.1 Deoxynucleoside triphosphate triphosphohydrolase SAMHD1 (668) ;mRNA; f:18359-20958